MAGNTQTSHNTHSSHDKFPWSNVIGFALSIVLTLLALWVGLASGFSDTTILIIIFVFAFFQAALQLLMFMHMTESSSGWIQTLNTVFAAFIAIVIVAGTVWVMGSHGGHSEHQKNPPSHGEHGEHEGK
ncbi:MULTISPECIES: cytochrome aa3 quinol oxidase subunit IV [Bacillaceae]|uniref:Quinol oxidase subunit 4 n=2 Tax=Metabacillus TaxID=2675233 RepID=A0ABS5LK03_9BACI|nr:MULTISPECIES: cytochrome aa3 quinol oxidase subunit IV [Bacillaceae]KZZ85411.1 cytochrome aa3 quinol oxidase subunit IV [Bacillus sp. SJS]MBS2970941.1 cytochrome aa3 quinol oxidase subunit IV [Metabacillus flavus]